MPDELIPGKKKTIAYSKPSTFKMKNSALNMSARTGSPMQANYGSPMNHGVTGADGKKSYRGHSHEGMSLSQRLGLTKEPTKIEKDISAVGDDLQSTAGKVKTATEKVTDKFAGDVSKVKSNVEKTTQKIGDRIAGDIKTLKETDLPRQFISDVKTKISKVKSKYADYKANRNKGESRWDYNRRKKREATGAVSTGGVKKPK